MSHALDRAADEFAGSLVEKLRAVDIAGTVSHIVFSVQQTATMGSDAYVFVGADDDHAEENAHDGGHYDAEVSCGHSQESIPGSVDDEDLLLAVLATKHGIDHDSLSWGSLPSIPLYALHYA